MPKLRLILADDHALVRAGFRALLEKMDNVEVAGEAADGRAALELVRTLRPDLLLLDISMAGLNGLETLIQVRRDFPEVKVLILSGHANEEYVLRALRGGAAGYLLKDVAVSELQMALQSVRQGQTYLSPAVSRTVVEGYLSRSTAQPSPAEQLTNRQREILQLIAEGRNTKEIAHLCTISIKTAEAHRSQLMERLDIHDVAGLVRFAIRNGLVSADT